MKRYLLTILAVLTLSFPAIQAQQKYFVDGFHGGVYGHYPLMTYTQFMVDQMNQHPDWYIGLEIEPETWDTVMVKTPEAYRAFQEKLKTAQAEYTNPSYAQSYLYCITGESIIRQFEYGMKKIRQHFPEVLIATYSVEEPCFTSCLPGILSQFGFRHAVLKCPNTCWGGYSAPYGGELVNFIGPDGTSLVSVPRYACEELEKNSVWQTAGWGNSPEFFKACFDYGIKNPVAMTYQDAGWTNGPWIGSVERKLRGTKYTRWTKYIEEQSVGATTDDYHFSQEDVRPGLMWGTQVMQRLAQQCRVSEYLIPQAEKMASMAFLANGFHPNQADIDEAWRELLLSQHHDCWIVPYNRLNARGNWADNVKLWTSDANKLSKRVIDSAFASYEEYGKPALKVFNTSGFRRTEVINVGLADGRYMDVKVDVPAFGYVLIPTDQLVEPAITKTVKVGKKECVMENDCVRIVVDLQKGGVVKSFVLKETGYEYIDTQSEYAFGELRGFFDQQKRFISSKEKPATVTVLEDNALVKCIRIEGDIAGTMFQQTMTLREGSPLVDCSIKIDWKENQRIGDFTRPMRKAKSDKRTTFYDTRYALSLMFPTSLKDAKLFKNAPFDVCESKLDNTFFNDWDSIKHNVIVEWVSLTPRGNSGNGGNQCLGVLTDHTTSYSFGKDYPLALTAQYSGPGLWGRDYRINGPTTFRYALMPYKVSEGDSESEGDSDGKASVTVMNQVCTSWNEPLIALNSYSDIQKSESFIDVTDTGFELVNVINKGNDIFVRLHQTRQNAGSQSVCVAGDVKRVVEVDFLDNEGKTLEVKHEGGKSRFDIELPQHGVRTYKITR